MIIKLGSIMKTETPNNNDEEKKEDTKPYEYFEQIITKKIQHYYLSGYIEEPANYVKMIYNITTATPAETIIIHLNTPGGVLSTGIQLINAMQFSQGHIVCSLEGEADSLGSLIFLAADEFIIHDNSTMMIHNFTGGTYGKGNEQVSQLEANIKWFDKLARDYYLPFITEKELGNILKDEDLWLQTKDIRNRIIKMVKTIQRNRKTNS